MASKRKITIIRHPHLEKDWIPMKRKKDQPNRLYVQDRYDMRILVAERGEQSMSVFEGDTFDVNTITDEQNQSLSVSKYE